MYAYALDLILLFLGGLYIIQTEIRLWKLEDELLSISFPELASGGLERTEAKESPGTLGTKD